MKYDLEQRTKSFAIEIRVWLKHIVKSVISIEDIKQLTRSSGSIGANYIEANESLSKKDFLMRIKIAKKEAKESIYWLEIMEQENSILEMQRKKLIKECGEIMHILGAIQRNSQL